MVLFHCSLLILFVWSDLHLFVAGNMLKVLCLALVTSFRCRIFGINISLNRTNNGFSNRKCNLPSGQIDAMRIDDGSALHCIQRLPLNFMTHINMSTLDVHKILLGNSSVCFFLSRIYTGKCASFLPIFGTQHWTPWTKKNTQNGYALTQEYFRKRAKARVKSQT